MMKNKNKIGFYTLLVIGLSWLFWIPAIFISQNNPGTSSSILHYLGGAVPLLVTLFFLLFQENSAERKDYWQRLIQFKRISWPWYGVIFCLVPLLTFTAAGVDVLFGGTGLTAAGLNSYQGQVLSLLGFAFFLLFFGPIPEEMAWRGYLQNKLQQKTNPVKAGFWIGIIWMIWHLPLFGIQGSYQHGLGIGSLPFWLFLLDKIPMSIVMAWVFTKTNRSTLSAIFLHFMINFTGELFDLSLFAESIYILLWWLLAVLIWVIWEEKSSTVSREFPTSGF
jgi:membrane protease YdiL (CAAX protease family)